MKKEWIIVYYETKNGECEIQEFIDSRNEREQAKILSWLSLLEERGPNLPRPYADILTEGIHELRLTLSGDQIRILYFFCFGDFIVLTHSFSKTTKKVPKSEIRKAQKYQRDFLNRYNEKKLRSIINENL